MDSSGPVSTSTLRSTEPFQSSRKKPPACDLPSKHYNDIEAISVVTLRHAASPPKPTLPRRPGTRTWALRERDKNPLTSGLLGPGRAGKYGELVGQSGGRYVGEVLAGRPHGQGQYLVPKTGGRTAEWVVQFEGEWAQGRKEGLGTYYYANGESYTGDWVANVRHGTGRFFFDNGDMYAGDWVDDKRTGHGTLYSQNGDVFVGNFIRDRKEGMGTLYMVSRQKKYIAEYVAGAPKCGTVLNIEDGDLEPLPRELKNLVLAKRMDQLASGEHVAPLPPLQLLQPNKVLAREVADVRKQRTEGSKAMKELQSSSGTLTNKEIEMLRHSYTLMAAGDGPTTGILSHQLRELCVMAGLDPAADGTRQLVEQLLTRKNARTGRIDFDAFMKTVIHFQDTSKAPVRIADVESEASQQDAAGSEVPEDDEQWLAVDEAAAAEDVVVAGYQGQQAGQAEGEGEAQEGAGEGAGQEEQETAGEEAVTAGDDASAGGPPEEAQG